MNVDVICVGHACYDISFFLDRPPAFDDKIIVRSVVSSGGGPAANAAIGISRLGLRAAFIGYLGTDVFGRAHLAEFEESRVDTSRTVLGRSKTSVSTILVQTTGERLVVNCPGDAHDIEASTLDLRNLGAKVLLFDGRQAPVAAALMERAQPNGWQTILDAGGMHPGTLMLIPLAHYVVASRKCACDYANTSDPEEALGALARIAPTTVVTLGKDGLIWARQGERGALPAFPVTAVDTTGAGDAFHAAFAAGLLLNLDWPTLLRFASAAGALACTVRGARAGMPTIDQLNAFVQKET